MAYALVYALSPAVWVAQATRCADGSGAPLEYEELTGYQLFRSGAGEGNEAVAWVWVVIFTCLIAGLPFLAASAPTLGRRLAWHVAGLLGAVLAAWMTGFLVAFTIFFERVVRLAGHLVLLCVALPVVESIARIVYGVIELRAARRGEKPPLASDEGVR